MERVMEVLAVYQAKALSHSGIAVNIMTQGAIATDFSDEAVR